MHLPVDARPGAQILGIDPAGQAVLAQVFARRASWWNPGAGYVSAQLGYTPANKAGDTFAGPVGVGEAPVAGRQLTVGNTGTDANAIIKGPASFSATFSVVGNGGSATQGIDLIHASTGEAYLWQRLNYHISIGTNNSESARVTAAGSFNLLKAGQGFGLKEGGAGPRMGTVGLVAGTATVNTTSVTAGSRIFVSAISAGGTPGHLYAAGIVAGTSFTITSSSASDTRTVAWIIFEPT